MMIASMFPGPLSLAYAGTISHVTYSKSESVLYDWASIVLLQSTQAQGGKRSVNHRKFTDSRYGHDRAYPARDQ
jgi:hypothetical protein